MDRSLLERSDALGAAFYFLATPARAQKPEQPMPKRNKPLTSVLPKVAPAQARPRLARLSAAARAASLEPRPTPLISETPPLLHTRSQAARMLNCSTSMLMRLEKMGQLQAVKLNKQKANAQ